jgi:hypothetical protein
MVFWVGFCENWAEIALLCWTKCGELRGKRGELTRTFAVEKMGHPFAKKIWCRLSQLLLFEGEAQLLPLGEEVCALGAEAFELGGGALGVFG